MFRMVEIVQNPPPHELKILGLRTPFSSTKVENFFEIEIYLKMEDTL